MEAFMVEKFEEYIKDYRPKFSELSEYANGKKVVEKYFSSTKGNYKKAFDKNNNFNLKKFAIRYYRAKKKMYASSQMLIEAKKNKSSGCIIGYFFLCYYSLFHAIQSLLFLNPRIDNEKVLDLSHTEVKKYFEDFYCKGTGSIMPAKILEFFSVLKEYRELYSYVIPFNNPSEL